MGYGIDYPKVIAEVFYTYAIDDFLSHHQNKDRMKLIFYRYFINGLDLTEISKEVELTRERVRQILEKCIRIIYSSLERQCEILDYTKKQAERTSLLEFELARLKKIEQTEIEKDFVKIPNDVPLDDLDMSVRAYNLLKAARMKTLGDLASYSKKEVRRFRNCGIATVKELEGILKQNGFKFKNS